MADQSSSQLTKRDRLARAARSEPVDRPPISFWRHFPEVDQDPVTLAQAMIDFQTRYDLDLVKLMPSGMYSVVDYGVVTGEPNPVIGARARVGGDIADVHDLLALPAVHPTRGSLGAELQVIRRVKGALDPDVTVIETIFSPLTMLAKMSPAPLSVVFERLGPRVSDVLKQLADDVIAFAQQCISAGADGFFYATQWAETELLTDEQHEQFAAHYDMAVLETLREHLVMLHLHGAFTRFELADRYGVDWVNWEDRDSLPSLAPARAMTSAGLAGGIPRASTSLSGNPALSARYIGDSIAAMGSDSRLMIAPGCVLHQDVTPAAMQAMRQAVDDAAVRS